MSIGHSSSVIWIPKTTSFANEKLRIEITHGIPKSTSPRLSDTTFLAHCTNFDCFSLPFWVQVTRVLLYSCSTNWPTHEWCLHLNPSSTSPKIRLLRWKKENETVQPSIRTFSYRVLLFRNGFILIILSFTGWVSRILSSRAFFYCWFLCGLFKWTYQQNV